MGRGLGKVETTGKLDMVLALKEPIIPRKSQRYIQMAMIPVM